ncbi:MAG: hypothetical protein J4452_00075 [Candidatus Aenigmarchaeota archaeon]|nr:hypothetical protein [Candidatus Aenigmarchaeota archaeon]
MPKGSMFNIYFLLFVSGAILALVIIYVMIYGGLGVAKSLLYYEARTVVETLASTTSAVASHHGEFLTGIIYRGSLPSGICDLKVEGNKVTMKIPEQLIPTSPTDVKIKEAKIQASESTMEIPVPNYIQIKPFTAKCEKGISRSILIQKQGNEVWFVTA